ncbi:hypothetical protein H5410_061864 [Solanum commersonii]|uniref:Uncharacterized protein n=1 Tax=Solanum commersonii TaxID=4109 RepID=A0A9J5W967_SOLCO|nr:hypothetical protein H5410_061864 [Solanum commersonii]
MMPKKVNTYKRQRKSKFVAPSLRLIDESSGLEYVLEHTRGSPLHLKPRGKSIGRLRCQMRRNPLIMIMPPF